MAWYTGTATDYKDMLDELVAHATAKHVESLAIDSAGSGYVAGETVTVNGGTALQAATIYITSVGGSGEVTGVQLLLGGGSYTADPSSPNSPTGGSGTGLSVTFSMVSNGWTALRDTTYTDSVFGNTHKQVILRGDGPGGSDEIYVGVRTYRDPNEDNANWHICGFTGYDAGKDWLEQPGRSPGRWEFSWRNGGTYLPLDDDNSFPFWMSVNGQRIILVARPGTSYMSCYMGFINTFQTTSELPYPLMVTASTAEDKTRFSSNRGGLCGIADPTKLDSNFGDLLEDGHGPMFLRFADGSWWNFTTHYEDTNDGSPDLSRTFIQTSERSLWPTRPVAESSQYLKNPDRFSFTQNWNTNELIDDSPTPRFQVRPTPDGGDGAIPIFPLIMHSMTPSPQIIGEIDNVWWCPLFGTSLSSEDALVIGNHNYRIFPSAFRTEPHNFFCVKEV